jgi:hypothetical protein
MDTIKGLITNLVKNECVIATEQRDLLLLFQQFDDRSDIKWFSFKDEMMKLAKRSMMNPVFFEEWLEEQRENTLPNSSSGSFYTALTDVDNIFCNFESFCEEVDHEQQSGDFSEEVYEIIETMLKG